MEKKKQEIELRSREVEELIGTMPSGILRYGIGTILLLLLSFIVASRFVPYPDISYVPIEIIANIETKPITSPKNGKILHTYVEENTTVNRGDTLLTTITEDGYIYYIIAPCEGTLHFFTFCYEGEKIKTGQLLLEIHIPQNRPIQTIAITNWKSTKQHIHPLPEKVYVTWKGCTLQFHIKQTLTDEYGNITKTLWISDKPIFVTHAISCKASIVTKSISLFDKIFGNKLLNKTTLPI